MRETRLASLSWPTLEILKSKGTPRNGETVAFIVWVGWRVS